MTYTGSNQASMVNVPMLVFVAYKWFTKNAVWEGAI